MSRKLIYSIAILSFVVPVSAVTVGELQPGGGTVASRGGTLAPLTLINMSRPALSGGNVDRATVIWTAGPTTGCEDAFEVKFFRPTETGLTVVASRGPFDVLPGINRVTLDPPVAILAGDMLGITQLQPVSCGGVANARKERFNVLGAVPSDPDSGIVANIEQIHGVVMSARATSEASPVHGYVPVVGSTQGSFGSLFRTSMQLTNRGTATIAGRLVFHPAGRSGASTDPSLVYELLPAQTLSVDDVLASMNTSGIGSLDVIPTTGYPPDVTARVYNDEGAGGTSGFTQELMTPYEALQRFDRGSLTIPTDLTNLRMNVGIRTLESGAEIVIIGYDANGVLANFTLTRTYPANYFEQVTLAQFLGGNTPPPGGFIVIQMQSGSAFVYGAVTDNRTNDGSIRFPEPF